MPRRLHVTRDDINEIPKRITDKTGFTRGDFVVLGFSRIEKKPKSPQQTVYWICECKCGAIWEIAAANINVVRGCSECAIKRRINSAVTKHELYQTWSRLKHLMCEDWHDPYKFFNDVGKRPAKKYFTYDQSKPIGPNNFMWSCNKSMSKYSKNGKLTNIRTVSEKLGLSKQRIYQKIEYAKKLGIDPTTYVYADERVAKQLRSNRNVFHNLIRGLKPGVNHLEFRTAREAQKFHRILRGKCRMANIKSSIRTMENHMLVKISHALPFD